MANSRPLLLDTSALLWSGMSLKALSASAKLVLSDPEVARFISVVSVWEMQIKHGLGKLSLPDTADRVAVRYAGAIQADLLGLTLDHISALYKLPNAHRDPFDRLLVAQALIEGLTIVSPDPILARYPVNVLW